MSAPVLRPRLDVTDPGFAEWNSATAYLAGDSVTRNGAIYRCVRDCTNVTPESATANWSNLTIVPAVQTGLVAATSGINSTEGLVTPVLSLVPGTAGVSVANGVALRVGSKLIINVAGTCTSSAANVPTFALRAGILGTTGDASVMSWAFPAAAASGTAIPFIFHAEVTVRTLGATGTAAGSAWIQNGGTTGLQAVAAGLPVAATSSTLATLTATALEATFVAAAATTTITVQDGSIVVIP